METVNCDLCGYNEYAILDRRGRFNSPVTNVACKRCGLVFINPHMDKEEYRRFNLEDYRRIYRKPEEPTAEFVNYQLYRGKEIFNLVTGCVKPKARILDVGCTVGGVLRVFAQRLNCEVYGIEIAERLAQYASKNFGVKIFSGFFEDNNFPSHFFDLIIMSHVLEHFYSPTYCLGLAKKILKSDGKIYIEVPNIFRPYGKITSFFQTPHLYTFSPKTLALLCENVGLKIIKTDDKKRNICVVVESSLSDSQLSSFLNKNEDYLKIIKSIKRYKLKYTLYLRYFNFIIENYHKFKGKIGQLVNRYVKK